MESIMYECDENDIENIDFIPSMLTELAGRFNMPRMLRGRVAKQRLLEDYGEKAFLNPANLSHPIINPKSGNFDCDMLNKAYYELATCSRPGALDMKAKCKSIMENNSCRVSATIKIQDDVEMELDHFLFYFA